MSIQNKVLQQFHEHIILFHRYITLHCPSLSSANCSYNYIELWSIEYTIRWVKLNSSVHSNLFTIWSQNLQPNSCWKSEFHWWIIAISISNKFMREFNELINQWINEWMNETDKVITAIKSTWCVTYDQKKRIIRIVSIYKTPNHFRPDNETNKNFNCRNN